MPEEVSDSRRPADTPFKQQRLWAWQPILSPKWVISCFFFIACAFIPIGAFIITASNEVIEIEVRYDNIFKNCHWAKYDDSSFTRCITERAQDTDLCGMIGSMDSRCPRDFGKPFNATKDELEAMGDPNLCDPKCTGVVSFEITETMDSPIYVYYKLTNFYQNHRRYAKSRADAQLAGESIGNTESGECSPLEAPADMSDDEWCKGAFDTKCQDIPITKCSGGVDPNTLDCKTPGDTTQLVGDLLYSPCGLVAWSKFNDSFLLEGPAPDPDNPSKGTWPVVCDGNNTDAGKVGCTKDGIAWDADKDEKFAAPKMGPGIFTGQGFKDSMRPCLEGKECSHWVKNKDKGLLPFLYHGWYIFEPYHKIANPEDEDFMVWMRTASLPTFRKLYRRIDRQLTPGTYNLTIDNRFDISGFSGEKYFVLSTLTWVGGKNYFLGGTYVTIGCLCVLLAITFLIKNLFFRTNRQEAIASYQNPR